MLAKKVGQMQGHQHCWRDTTSTDRTLTRLAETAPVTRWRREVFT